MLQIILDILFPRKDKAVFSLSNAKRANKHKEAWIESVFCYKDKSVRDLIWQLKFKKNREVAKLFAEIISSQIPENYTLVPIPSSNKRIRSKGFNQTFLVCNYLKGSPIKKDLLFRKKHSKPQSHIKSRDERIKNVKGCFWAKQTDLENIIIFDDVTTTGATLKEAREALLNAGAKNVKALTIAH